MTRPKPRRSRQPGLNVESLESRALLTHGLSLNLEVLVPPSGSAAETHVSRGQVLIVNQNLTTGGHHGHHVFAFR